jgi:hypothetical protein
LCFQRRLKSRTREIPANNGLWSPGSSKEPAMFTGLVIIAVIAVTGVYLRNRSRRHHL